VSQLQVRQVRIDGIEDMRRVLDGPYTSCVAMGSIAPRGSVLHASIGKVDLRAGQLSADVRIRADIDADNIAFSMKLRPDAPLFSFRSGKEVLPGDIFRLARGDVSDVRIAGEIRYAVICLSTDLLLQHGGEDALRGDMAFWEQRQWFRAPQEIRELIATSVSGIISHLSEPHCPVTGPALRQLQADLIESFLWGVLSDECRPCERHGLSSAALVRKVENWVDGRSAETIQIADVCRGLHISRRTLHRAFAETLGMGPSHYLTRRRLTAVRTELRRCHVGANTVTDIATKYGFWQLGRFAQQYRRLFGERPSETLGRGSKQIATLDRRGARAAAWN